MSSKDFYLDNERKILWSPSLFSVGCNFLFGKTSRVLRPLVAHKCTNDGTVLDLCWNGPLIYPCWLRIIFFFSPGTETWLSVDAQ